MKKIFNLSTALQLGLLGALLSFHLAEAASLALDENFRTPSFAEPRLASRTLLLPDGKFLVFYDIDTLTDQRTGAITRYLANGTLDSSFNFSRDYKFIAAAAPTASGQLIIAATKYVYGGGFRTEEILRLNTDGSIDASFNTALVGSDPYSNVQAIALQPDGKILVAGFFNSFAGLARQKIVRLLADGTLDGTFTPPDFGGAYNGIYPRPLVLSNGKIVIAGDFTVINGVSSLGVAQLNADGSLDSSFQPAGFTRGSSSTASRPIRGLAVQNDGKIVMAGRFQFGSGGTGFVRSPVIRLNTDGSTDASYAYVTTFAPVPTARDLFLQADGKAVATVNNSVYRFETTGPLDNTFTPPHLLDTTFYAPGVDGTPITANLQPDGRIILGGIFTDVNPSGAPDGSHFGVVRLNSDGTVDSSLVTSHKTGSEDFPSSFARLTDGSVLIAFGNPPPVRNAPAMAFNLGRLLPSGALDSSFSLSSSNPNSILSQGLIAQDFTQLADGRFLIFGGVDEGNARGKFLPNGVEDLSFQSASGITTSAFQKAIAAPDGKILLAAGSDAQATLYATLSRLQRNGSVDSGFQSPPETNQVVRGPSGSLYQIYVGGYVLAVQPNGKILFLYFSYDQMFHFVRLNTDGSLDGSFAGATITPIDLTVNFPVVYDPLQNITIQPPDGVWSATAPFQDAHVLPDGRIILCGSFTSFNGTPARGMVRLQSNGTIDNTFTVGSGPQWTQTVETPTFFPSVENMEEQVDGKLLIVGTFEAFNGTALPGIASLNPNGTLDASFVPPAKRQRFANGKARLARQSDGSFLLSGPYSFPNENDPRLIHIKNIGGIPVVGSPAIATAVIGQLFSYQVVASGQPISYSASGLPPGFTIDPVTGLISGTPNNGNIGVYTVLLTATNAEGTSTTFQLVLTVPPPAGATLSSLLNISTRLRVLTGDNVLIGGFIITGNVPKRVIVRGIGPSLTNLGVGGALADPVLELHGPGGFTTLTNNNWKDTQQAEIEATTIPPSNDLESAIVATLPPGAYTAIVRDQDNGTGVGLVEAYDLDSGADAQLANISTRGFVDTGENVMIGGLIAGPGGTTGGQMLVRAIGPSLSSAGVQNALQDPTLELHDSNGSLIATNDDWQESEQAAIAATGIPPVDNKEAAILSTLWPGSYTAIVRGTNNGVGVALVEIYNLK